MNGYPINKNRQENKSLYTDIDIDNQEASSNKTKTNKFWKKKCISSDFHQTGNVQNNKVENKKSRQRLNRVQIR